jgi:ParB family transcriptional regulator, chromosome partitioning protein
MQFFSDSIRLNALGVSPLNVRQPDHNSPQFQQLFASIAANGLIEPLIVEPTRLEGDSEVYDVLQGGHRLAVMQKLAYLEVYKWTLDRPIACHVVTGLSEAEAREVALATSVIRGPLHPVDEYEAFAALERDGLSPEKIADHFGIPLRGVKQRLALGRLAPGVRKAWRDGSLSADAAQAFTAARDIDAQEDLLAQVSANFGSHHPNAIIRIIKEGLMKGRAIASTMPEWLLIGAEAYHAAGGASSEDLFSEDTVIEDVALLKKLGKAEALSLAETFKTDHGFGAIAFYDGEGVRSDTFPLACESDIEEDELSDDERAILQKLDAEIEALPHWQHFNEIDDADERNRVRVETRAREMALRRQLREEEDRILLRTMSPALRAMCIVVARLEHDGHVTLDFNRLMPGMGEVEQPERKRLPDTQDAAEKAAPIPEEKGLAQSQKDRLAALMESVCRASLIAHPSAALPLLLASLHRMHDTPIQKSLTHKCVTISDYKSKFVSELTRICTSPPEKVAAELATAVAAMLVIQSTGLEHQDDDRGGAGSTITLLESLDETFQERIRKAFDAEAFFMAAPKAFALQALEECGSPAKDPTQPRKQLAPLAAACARPHGWLPPILRTAKYALLTPGQEKKPAKAAKPPKATSKPPAPKAAAKTRKAA